MSPKVLLYLHIPYCDSKCHYCSFNSYVDKFDTRTTYMQALCRQLEFELKRFSVQPDSLDTLFIGGGTPSTIPPELYAPVFELLDPYLKKDAEITTEANPNSASETWLSGMRSLGVNRISFGVQSFDAAKLKALNRAHSPAEAIEAIHTAKALGFEHLSLDIIYNFQGDTKALLLSDIRQAFTLPIDHISAYELTIEAKTNFAKRPEARQENDALAHFVAKSITEQGFTQYEISNFGSYQSRHNKGYWRLENYIGAGAGAVGFLEDTRYYPLSDIDAYIADPMKISEERVSENDLMTEKIFLGLRSTIGIDKALLPTALQQRADYLVEREKLILDNGTYQNPDLFLADEIALYLLD
ncbi:MAG: radical SAM family heme chaperone HemW [Campylobacterota bacterium]|nr:radical SAM family heme chaperone HemW [Campylobacterota bacterium]